MPRLEMDRKPIRRVLEWLLGKDLADADMAAALGMPPTNYSRHKDSANYPSFEVSRDHLAKKVVKVVNE
jgi:hypothetical protein